MRRQGGAKVDGLGGLIEAGLEEEEAEFAAASAMSSRSRAEWEEFHGRGA
jgi:hypothetical protein